MPLEVVSTVGLFLAGSALLLYLSRASLRVPGSHGFYRFFAWEFILTLLMLNVRAWFRAPLSPTQLIAWFLLVVSGVLIADAVSLLRRHGRLDARRQDVPLVAIEKTTSLVTEGVYRYIRHPMYSSLLFLAWGIFFKNPTWIGACLGAAATGLLVATAKADEFESTRFFGQAYVEYMQNTKMFVPFIF